MNRLLATTALALALCAPVAAHATGDDPHSDDLTHALAAHGCGDHTSLVFCTDAARAATRAAEDDPYGDPTHAWAAHVPCGDPSHVSVWEEAYLNKERPDLDTLMQQAAQDLDAAKERFEVQMRSAQTDDAETDAVVSFDAAKNVFHQRMVAYDNAAKAQRCKRDEDARAAAANEARAKAEAERPRIEAEAKAKVEAERAQIEADAKAKVRAQIEADLRAKAVAEATAKAEADAKADIEAATQAKDKAAADAKAAEEARLEAEAVARNEDQVRKDKEAAEAKARSIARAKKEAVARQAEIDRQAREAAEAADRAKAEQDARIEAQHQDNIKKAKVAKADAEAAIDLRKRQIQVEIEAYSIGALEGNCGSFFDADRTQKTPIFTSDMGDHTWLLHQVDPNQFNSGSPYDDWRQKTLATCNELKTRGITSWRTGLGNTFKLD